MNPPCAKRSAESAALNIEIVRNIERSTTLLQQWRKEYSLERVEELMEDSREAMEVEREMSAVLERSPSIAGVEEAEVDAELKRLAASMGLTSEIFPPAAPNTREAAQAHEQGNESANVNLPELPTSSVLSFPEVPSTSSLPTQVRAAAEPTAI